MADRAGVRFGYEVGTGKPINIPLRHMVITGQSQEAGKTTALEALVARSGVQAVAFITKRGESSFGDARVIRPYFTERTGESDFLEWKYVASILEASLGEKLKFERSWIMRATKGARTLADVSDNVKAALADPKTRGLSADVYYALGEYLKAIVPQIAKVRWATTVELAPGVSAMDLTSVNESMQHLVIRSTLDWVLNNADNTVVVIPEAWKFIPEGRSAPVKLAAEAYIRQGAGLKNYLWLDSQDIAGVDKTILKQVTVWVLGVQRESNEVKRTLAQIPRRIKEPTPDAIATLGLGEFYVCHGTSITKVYAQPKWMSDEEAQETASADIGIKRIWPHAPLPKRPEPVEDEVTPERAVELERENARLTEENHALRNDLRLKVQLIERGQAGRTAGGEGAKADETKPGGREISDPSPSSAEALLALPDSAYQEIKRRLMAEAPGILRLLTVKPELEVTVERPTLTFEGSTYKGRIARLLKDGFFREPKGIGSARSELKRTGNDVSPVNIVKVLDELKAAGFLIEPSEGQYQEVVGVKVNIREA